MGEQVIFTKISTNVRFYKYNALVNSEQIFVKCLYFLFLPCIVEINTKGNYIYRGSSIG